MRPRAGLSPGRSNIECYHRETPAEAASTKHDPSPPLARGHTDPGAVSGADRPSSGSATLVVDLRGPGRIAPASGAGYYVRRRNSGPSESNLPRRARGSCRVRHHAPPGPGRVQPGVDRHARPARPARSSRRELLVQGEPARVRPPGRRDGGRHPGQLDAPRGVHLRQHADSRHSRALRTSVSTRRSCSIWEAPASTRGTVPSRSSKRRC